jgi:outer membrane lipopolysaccharide assembly protein LptE/RlpB
MRRPAAGLLAVAVGVLAGCGYTVGGTLPPHIRTVAVTVFANHTREPAVEGPITAAVVDALSSSGRVRVVPRAEADAVLEGEIVGYQIQALAVDRRSNISEYRLLVTVNLRFRDLRQGTLLWREDGLQEQADFRVAGAVAATIAREEGALRLAALDIGRKIVSLALDRF